METLRASFPNASSAAAAQRALVKSGVAEGDIRQASVDELNALGDQSARDGFEVSPDAAVSEGAEASGVSSAAGAAIGGAIGTAVGIVSTPIFGPVGIAAGAGVGAYAGSLVGALAGLESAEPEADIAAGDETAARAALAVTVTDAVGFEQVRKIVDAFGATVRP